MKFLPFENYTISTGLSIDEAKKRLLDNLEPERNPFYVMRRTTKPFTGKVDDEGFKISRVIRYRNSFLPVVKGRFVDDMGHAEIDITMRPTLFVLAFMSVWMGGVLLAFIAALNSMISHVREEPFSPAFLGPFIMLLFGYGLCTIAFKAESSKAKAFLNELWAK